MPKAARKHYAICIGRKGPQIVDTWEECKAQVSRYPGAIHRSFLSRKEAQEWLENELKVRGDTIPRGPRPVADNRRLKTQIPSGKDELSSESVEKATTLPTTTSEGMTLSPEQAQVLNMVKEGRNVFFTGSAGTGKSVLLREIIKWVKESGKTVGITASTGIAAVNIGGCTLHSWAGIGLGDQKVENYVGKFFSVPSFKSIQERWKAVEILIIDEISMLDGGLFDKIEMIAQGLRKNQRPFGGIQLVLCGDFFQLPPVSKASDVKFAFEAEQWDACVGPPIFLSRVYRQKDQSLVDMLNAMRFGKIEPRMIKAFKDLARKVTYKDGVEPTELYSTREEVNNSNLARLKQLNGQRKSYVSIDLAGYDSHGRVQSQEQLDKILDRLVVPKFIQLKVGAQVMLIKNLIQGRLVNGSVGQIIQFCGVNDASKNGFEIPVVGENKKPPPDDGVLYPVVRFPDVKGKNEFLILRQEFTVNNPDGGVEASRHQVPLILAWALSVHKSQGQTIERVKVDLKKTFEKGQAYVALSRATRLEQLEVLNFDITKVHAHPRVTAWHSKHAPADLQERANVIEIESDDEDLPPPHIAFFN